MSTVDDQILQQLIQTAGPVALPQIQRSAYLANALDQISKSGEGIKSWGALGANLGAEALTRLAQNRQQKKMADLLSDASTAYADRFHATFHPAPDGATAPTQAAPVGSAPIPGAMAAPLTAPVQPASAGASVVNDPSDPKRAVFMRLLAEGYPRGGAAGLVGNFSQESGPNLDRSNPAEGAIGMANWEGPRSTSLRQYAQAHGGLTPQTQTDFLIQELRGPESPASRALMAAGDDPSKGAAAGLAFERPAGYRPGGDPAQASGWAQRQAAAQAAMQAYGQQQGVASPPPQAMAQGQPPVQPAPQMAPQSQAPQMGGPVARGLGSINPQYQAYIEGLLRSQSFADQQKGRQLAEQAMQAAAQNVTWKDASVNGVPMFYNPENPSQTMMGQIPEGAMSHNRSAADLNINAPQGTVFNVSPTGGTSTAFAPPSGYQMEAGGHMGVVPGSAADPTAAQNRVTAFGPGVGAPGGGGAMSGLPAGTAGYTDATGKPTVLYAPSDTERGKAYLTYRTLTANEELNRLADHGVFKPSMNNFWQNFLGGNDDPKVQAMMSPQDRQLYQAAMAFAYPFLRKESGAVLSPSEIRQTMVTLLPLPTDDNATLWQKAQRRGDILKGLEGEAGSSFRATYPDAPHIRSMGPSPGHTPSAPQAGPRHGVYNSETGQIEYR